MFSDTVKRFGEIGHAIALVDDLDFWKLSGHKIGEALLAGFGGGCARLHFHHGDLARAVEDLSQARGGHLTGGVIVGGHLGDEVRSIDAGIEDDDGDVLRRRAIDDGGHNPFVDGGEGDGGDVAVNHRLDDLDLPGVVGLLRRAVPKDLHLGFARGLDGAAVDGLPEEMSAAFGNDADDDTLLPSASGREQAQNERAERRVFGQERELTHERWPPGSCASCLSTRPGFRGRW